MANTSHLAGAMLALCLASCGGDSSPPPTQGGSPPPAPSPSPTPTPPPPPPPIVLAGASVGDTLRFDEICSNAIGTASPDGFYVVQQIETKVLDPVDIAFTILGTDHYSWSPAGQSALDLSPTLKIVTGSSHHNYYIPSIPTFIAIAGESDADPITEVAFGYRYGPNNCFFAGGFRDPAETPVSGEFTGPLSGSAMIDGARYFVSNYADDIAITRPHFLKSDGGSIDVSLRLFGWDENWWDNWGSVDIGSLRATVKPGEPGVATIEGGLDGYTGEILVRSLSDGNALSGWFRLSNGSNLLFGIFAAEKQ